MFVEIPFFTYSTCELLTSIFSESLPSVKVCTVGEQCNSAHYIYCLMIWTGQLYTGSGSIL